MTAKRSFLFFSFPVTLFILCLFHPAACTEGVKKGLDTVLFSALPALFPGLVLSRMITLLLPKESRFSGRLLPLITGMLCGFPIGAHMVTEMVMNGSLSKKEGEKLLFCCNVTGPFFLILLCGKEATGSLSYGWFLFLLQSALAVLSYFLLFGMKKKTERITVSSVEKTPSFVFSVTESLASAINSFLYITACILFFSFLNSLLKDLIPTTPFSSAVFSSFLELTSAVADASHLPANQMIPLLGAAVGFGGCSVHLQTLGIIQKAKLSPRYYILGKLIFAVLFAVGSEFFQKYL